MCSSIGKRNNCLAWPTQVRSWFRNLGNCGGLEEKVESVYLDPVAVDSLSQDFCTMSCVKAIPDRDQNPWSKPCAPLIYAIQLSDLKLFDLLYTRGGSLFDRDAGEMNTLELLVENQEHGLFVDFILAKYRNNNNLDPDSKKHQMIFHLACFKGDTEMMQKSIQCNFSNNSHSNLRTKKWAGATPQQFAIRDSRYGDPSKAVSMLLKLDVDLNTQDKCRNTPLHSAIKVKHIQDQDTEEKFVDKVFKALEHKRF
ncbi:hypothetical protein QAD02_023455 [Eretmocerus hayati]|uniref:Uncharacterized protein n=1 Tax=Eretmocerus hayati TaxID=131215 RepID=A0ACC2PXJ9_9HYME|nr:hypothetical protein QAD02_023455 [Eretmocerus hayati]